MSKSVAVVSGCLVLIVVAAALRGRNDDSSSPEPDFAALTSAAKSNEVADPAPTGQLASQPLNEPVSTAPAATDPALALDLELELELAAESAATNLPSTNAIPPLAAEASDKKSGAEPLATAPAALPASGFALPPPVAPAVAVPTSVPAASGGFVRNPYFDTAGPETGNSTVELEVPSTVFEVPAPAPSHREPTGSPEAVSPASDEPELLPPLAPEGDLSGSQPGAARSRLEQGHRLAARGATAAAREEFIAALAAVADSRDHRTGSASFSQLLQRGLLHLDELRDFFPGAESSPIASTASIVETHGSELVPLNRAAGLSRQAATGIYQRAVAEKIGEICNLDRVAPEAVACIAKLHALRHAAGGDAGEYDFSVAVLLNEIACRCEPENPRYANELGVLYAMQGNLDASRDMFVQSLRQRQTVEVWTNLAQLHQRRKETRLADLAAGEARRLAEHLASSGEPGRVRWVSPAEFGGQPEPDHSVQSGSVLENGDRSASRDSGGSAGGLRRFH